MKSGGRRWRSWQTVSSGIFHRKRPSACDALRPHTGRARGLYCISQSKPMASSGAPSTFMLRCRQATAISLRNACLRKPHPRLQFLHQVIRAASTSSQAPATAAPAPASSPRELRASQRSIDPQPLSLGASPSSQPTSPWITIKSWFGFNPPSPASHINALNNPYRSRKEWPPNFETLHPKHQFHYEKTYRRRLKLKYAQPRLIKGTKLLQYGLSVAVVLYWIFLLPIEDRDGTIFDAVSVYPSRDYLL